MGTGLSGASLFSCLVEPVCVEYLLFPGLVHWTLTTHGPVLQNCLDRLPALSHLPPGRQMGHFFV